MPYQRIRVEMRGPAAYVTLNRPEVRNAMDALMISELTDCFTGLASRPVGEVRAVVLRGEGKDFCAGADLNWMREAAGYDEAANRADALKLARMLEAVEACPAPVIARVHGGVYGGALGLLAVCDAVVAAEDVRMAFTECRLGILPAVITTFVLPKAGLSQARRRYLTAEPFGGEAALRMGLAHELVPEAELDARVEALVKCVLQCAPGVLAATKAFLKEMAGLPREQAVERSVDALVKARSSSEGKEGLSAFLEKRRPKWSV